MSAEAKLTTWLCSVIPRREGVEQIESAWSCCAAKRNHKNKMAVEHWCAKRTTTVTTRSFANFGQPLWFLSVILKSQPRSWQNLNEMTFMYSDVQVLSKCFIKCAVNSFYASSRSLFGHPFGYFKRCQFNLSKSSCVHRKVIRFVCLPGWKSIIGCWYSLNINKWAKEKIKRTNFNIACLIEYMNTGT